MANTMTTYVKVVNLDPESHKKYMELFSIPENRTSVDVLENLNKMYGENFDEANPPSRDWMERNVGVKSIDIEENSVGNGEFSYEMDLLLSTPWSFPSEYLEKLIEVLGEDNEDIVIYGTYEDEGYSQLGAFLYANEYDDIEDLDYDVDEERMNTDDDYRDEMYEKLNSHRDSMYDLYLENME